MMRQYDNYDMRIIRGNMMPLIKKKLVLKFRLSKLVILNENCLKDKKEIKTLKNNKHSKIIFQIKTKFTTKRTTA